MNHKTIALAVSCFMSMAVAALPASRPASRPAAVKIGTTTTVFILETRGSMLPAFEEIQNELGKAINQLPADVGFNLIWFEEDKMKVLSQTPFLATDINKRIAYGAVLEAQARGAHEGKTLAAAIGRAQAMKADTVWIISVGFPLQSDCESAKVAINKLPPSKMKINTTLRYVGEGDEFSRAFLLQLAESSHGISIGRNGEILNPSNAGPDSGNADRAQLPTTLPSGPSIFRDK